MSYRFYIKVQEDGRITGTMMTAGVVMPGFFEVSEEDRRLIERKRPQVCWDAAAGKVQLKPEYKIVPEKPRILADSEDSVIVRFLGVPDWAWPLQIHIGSKRVELPEPELELESAYPDVILIANRDVRLFAKAASVQAYIDVEEKPDGVPAQARG